MLLDCWTKTRYTYTYILNRNFTMTSVDKGHEGLGELQTTKYEVENSPLSLFTKPIHDEFITGGREVFLGNFNTLSNASNTITILVPPFSTEYLRLDSIRCFMKVRILEKDSTVPSGLKNPTNTTDFSVCNYLSNAIWSKLSIKLNDLQIDSACDYSYPYKSFIETLFSYNDEAKRSTLQTSFWYEDEPSTADVNVKTANSGYNKRYNRVKGGKTLCLSFRLHHPLFFLKKHLIPQVSLKIELQKADENFFIIGKKDVQDKLKLVIDDIELRGHVVNVSKEVQQSHIMNLMNKKAIYPFTHSVVNFNSIPSGLQQTTVQGVFQGMLPTIVLCGLQDNSAISGTAIV